MARHHILSLWQHQVCVICDRQNKMHERVWILQTKDAALLLGQKPLCLSVLMVDLTIISSFVRSTLSTALNIISSAQVEMFHCLFCMILQARCISASSSAEHSFTYIKQNVTTAIIINNQNYQQYSNLEKARKKDAIDRTTCWNLFKKNNKKKE